MKQNILVMGYNFELSKRIAEKIADTFSMRVFDERELFLFDHMPRSFKDVYKTNGPEYIKKKLRSNLKMELSFEDAVYVTDIVVADNCHDMFHQVKFSNLVIFLHKDRKTELKELSKKRYSSEEEELFFAQDENLLARREEIIEKDCADIVIDISELSEDEIVEQIVLKIKEYYKVG